MQIDTHSDGCREGEGGLGNSTGGRRFLGILWGMCAGSPEVAPLFRGRWWPCAQYTHFPRLLSLSPAGLQFGISFGAGPECQEMLPTLSLPSRGSQTCVGTRASGTASRETGQARA